MKKRLQNPKQKGSAYERAVCNKLSLWVSDFTRKDIFWRSAMSGGRATVKAKKGESLKAQAGDITAVDPLGHFLLNLFMIECKHYRDLGWSPLIYEARSAPVLKFWIDLCLDAGTYAKAPMMIAKQNNKPDLVFLDRIGEQICINNIEVPLLIIPKIDMRVYYLRDLLMIPFDDIRARNHGKTIRQRLRPNNRRLALN